jgi:hypothetical protein
MYSSPVQGTAKDHNRQIQYPNRQDRTASSTCSPQAKCQFGEFIETSQWESGSDDGSGPHSNQVCILCANEPSISRPCLASSERRKLPPPPVCIDPDCSENICEDCPESLCEECSDHGESCQDCVVDCPSDCNISFCGDGLDCIVHDDYPYDDSYSELFGDQAAQISDLDGHLPQLPLDAAPTDLGNSGIFSGASDLSALAGLGAPDSSLGLYNSPESCRVPMKFCAQPQTLESAESAYLHDFTAPFPSSTFSNEWKSSPIVCSVAAAEGLTPTPDASFRRSSISKQITNFLYPASSLPHSLAPSKSEKSIQGKAVVLAPAERTMLQNSNVINNQPPLNRPVHPSAQCQWADANSEPCGRIFELGNDMHEHLRIAHGVKSEVFCRWIGCRFGVLGLTPHKYAYSVERHTWGHSGYRPYKCPTCSEGFAAANVRDEHFANFHLKRKMFSCDICTHKCTSARNLKRHKDDTHQTERFQCEFCNRHGKIRLFPRGSNLARHFRKCKYVLASYPDATGATGKKDDNWFPPGYKSGHQGMNKAKILPPSHLPVPK